MMRWMLVVMLWISVPVPANAGLIVEVFNTVDEAPDTLLASIPLGAWNPGVVTVDLRGLGITVVAGQFMAVVLRSTDESVLWVGSDVEYMPWGQTYYQTPSNPWVSVGGTLDHGMTYCVRPEVESGETCDWVDGEASLAIPGWPGATVWSLVTPGIARAQTFETSVSVDTAEPLDTVSLYLAPATQVPSLPMWGLLWVGLVVGWWWRWWLALRLKPIR